MTSEIEFDPRFILPIIDGTKTLTTRIHDRFGEVGDFLTVDGGENYGLRLLINEKQKYHLIPVTMYRYAEEGFISSREFMRFWDSLYGDTDYASKNDPEVIVIEFRVISQRYRRDWMDRMRREKGLF